MPSSEAEGQYSMLLHNEMQRRGILASLTWEDCPSGPRHKQTWLAIVYVNEVEYGRGCGSTKAAARNMAAREALLQLGVRV